MLFLPRQRRGKDADDAQVGVGAQKMRLVPVQHIDGAGTKRVFLTVGHVGHGAVAFDDIVGLDVVFVFQMLRAARLADRVMQGIAKVVGGEEDAAAFKAVACDMGGGVEDGGEGADDHGAGLCGLGVAGADAQVARKYSCLLSKTLS